MERLEFSKKVWRDKKIIPIFALLNNKHELICLQYYMRLHLDSTSILCETFQEEFIEKWHEHMDESDNRED